MPKRSVPAYCHHKATGQARVRIKGKDVYLGVFGSPESHRRYAEVIEEWQHVTEEIPDNLTIGQLTLLYLQFAKGHYRKDDKPTSKLPVIQTSLRLLNKQFRALPATQLTPKRFKLVRQAMIDAGLARSTCNDYASAIRRMVKWAVSEEMLPPEKLLALQTVPDLQRGRTAARETEAVRPVPEAFIEAVQPYVSAPVRGAIRFQLLTGARPSEALRLRGCDLQMTGEAWLYELTNHKMQHRGRQRIICIGPGAQKVLQEFLTTDLQAYIFGTTKSRRARPYRRDSYTSAIARACRAAEIPLWSPNQLRHNFATKARKEFGIEAARVTLGHVSAITSEIYAERDLEAARAVAAKIG